MGNCCGSAKHEEKKEIKHDRKKKEEKRDHEVKKEDHEVKTVEHNVKVVEHEIKKEIKKAEHEIKKEIKKAEHKVEEVYKKVVHEPKQKDHGFVKKAEFGSGDQDYKTYPKYTETSSHTKTSYSSKPKSGDHSYKTTTTTHSSTKKT